MQKPISLISNHRKTPEKPSAKILRCWPAIQKIGMLFKIERCEMPAIWTPAAVWLAMRVSAMPKSLAMWVERCEPLSPGPKLRTGLQNLGKQAFGRGHPWPEHADVHDPGGVQKTFVQKSFGLIVPSLRRLRTGTLAAFDHSSWKHVSEGFFSKESVSLKGALRLAGFEALCMCLHSEIYWSSQKYHGQAFILSVVTGKTLDTPHIPPRHKTNTWRIISWELLFLCECMRGIRTRTNTGKYYWGMIFPLFCTFLGEFIANLWQFSGIPWANHALFVRGSKRLPCLFVAIFWHSLANHPLCVRGPNVCPVQRSASYII